MRLRSFGWRSALRESTATEGKRERRLKYWENQARPGGAAKASNMTVVPLRGMPTKKIGRSTGVGRVPRDLMGAGLMGRRPVYGPGLLEIRLMPPHYHRGRLALTDA